MPRIRILGLATGGPCVFDGQYLVEYDPDQPGTTPDGQPMLAHIVCTPDPWKAKEFDSARDAMEEWRRVSKTTPVRPYDSKPNRPLTAFTVEVI